MKAFAVRMWGPPALQDILKSVQDAINERCPVDGLGIRVSYQDGGAQINQNFGTNKPDDLLGTGGPTGGSPTGTSGNLYGAVSGLPAQFHFFQSSAPTPVTP